MVKRSLSSDTTDASVKALRRHEPIVIAAAAGGNPDVSMEAHSERLNESFLLGTPSLSRETSQSLDESDYESCDSAKHSSDDESEYVEDDDDDDYQEEMALQKSYKQGTFKIPTLKKDEKETDSSGMIVYGVKDMDEGFGDALRDYMILVDAYPSVSKHDSSFINILKEIVKVPQGRLFRITDGVHDKYIKTTSISRAKLSSRVKSVLKSYTFEATNLPAKCKKNRRRQFKYMMDGMRFARKDHSSSGAILQSDALGDIMAKVFYNRRKGIALSLKDSDDQVPRPVIALTFVLMYANMGLLFSKKQKQQSLCARDVGAVRASLYRNTLQGVYDNGETVDWEEVQRIQTRSVLQYMQSSQESGPCSFGPLSATYQPKYQDGEYNSDSD